MNKHIVEVMHELVDAYVKVTGKKPHQAVQELNSGYCYMVATFAQYILKEVHEIEVKLLAHCHHSFIEYEGKWYDTIYPVGYPYHPSKVWRLKEAHCTEGVMEMEYGECRCVNPSAEMIVWMEHLCRYHGVVTPPLYEKVVGRFSGDVWGPGYTKTKHRRILNRLRSRSLKFKDTELEVVVVGWVANFHVYPEDLWVELEVVDYNTWMRSIIKTRYPDYEETMEKCFGKEIFSPDKKSNDRTVMVQSPYLKTPVSAPQAITVVGCGKTFAEIQRSPQQNGPIWFKEEK
ncbi:hypothetical protein [Vibrio phage phiKT1028]|nr:hypothetical protein [Vibrio phage phiKT1028]